MYKVYGCVQEDAFKPQGATCIHELLSLSCPYTQHHYMYDLFTNEWMTRCDHHPLK